MTAPVKTIINRDTPEDVLNVSTHFVPIIEECVNYGSQILYADRKPVIQGDESLVPVMLLRHFLETLDGISILLKPGNAESSKILVRALFETTLFIEFLFEKDTDFRAHSYIVSDIRRQLKEAKKFLPQKPESKNIYETIRKEGLSINPSNEDTQDILQFIKDKEFVLNQPHLKKINSEFEKAIKKGKRNPTWYSIADGPQTIEKLSEYLEQKTIYEVLYRKWSGAVHGTDTYLGKISAGDNEENIKIVQLRYIKALPEIALYSTLFSFKVFRLYISNRLPSQLEQHEKWFKLTKEQFKILKNTKLNII